jgi:hypothetical protein
VVYLRQGDGLEARRWILFSHEQDMTVHARLPAIESQSTPSNIELDVDRASTTEVLGVLGEDGWELVSTNWLPPLQAGALYFKRELQPGLRLRTPTPD